MVDASSTSKTNKRCVVILGAGASVPFGVPAMNGLLTDEMLAKDDHGNESKAKWGDTNTNFKEQVKQLREELKTTNVEEILTAVLDDTTKYSIKNKEEFRKRMHIFLKHSVYKNISVKRSNHLNSLFQYCKDEQFIHTTWCSFNWDCIFESAFYYSHGHKNPRLGIRSEVKQDNFYTPTQNRDHIFLKLHGGINWWWNDSLPENGNDSPPKNEFSLTFLKTHSGEKAGKYVNHYWNKYEAGEAGSEKIGRPAILEPISNKYDKGSEIYNKLLKPQWDEFASNLRDADTIIIVGYSLPKTDGDQMKSILKESKSTSKIVVFDKNPDVRVKYENIFNSNRIIGWIRRPYQEYQPKDFKDAISRELRKIP